MRILQIYNNYRSGGGGETAVVNNTIKLLREHGHEVRLLKRDRAGVSNTFQKMSSAINGVYSLSARREVGEELDRWTPDIVHVHNLYPLLSPSVLGSCKARSIPVVMTVHNYGLTCPIQTHLRHGQECNRCVVRGDYECITSNCRSNLVESVVYSFRHAVAKHFGLFNHNVTVFLPVSEFVRDSLVAAGIPISQSIVIPNGVALPSEAAQPEKGSFVLYLGRYIREKGIPTIMSVAKELPEVPFRFYGEGPMLGSMRANASSNISIHSWVSGPELADLYRQARCVVIPSVWNDPCPMVAIEAFGHGLPVVASRVGGLTSMIIDGETGFLVKPECTAELKDRLQLLMNDPELAGRLGRCARETAKKHYSDHAYYEALLGAYVAAGALEHSPSLCAS